MLLLGQDGTDMYLGSSPDLELEGKPEVWRLLDQRE